MKTVDDIYLSMDHCFQLSLRSTVSSSLLNIFRKLKA